jgi:hypothetical protein
MRWAELFIPQSLPLLSMKYMLDDQRCHHTLHITLQSEVVIFVVAHPTLDPVRYPHPRSPNKIFVGSGKH